jgi:hypothetical protein
VERPLPAHGLLEGGQRQGQIALASQAPTEDTPGLTVHDHRDAALPRLALSGTAEYAVYEASLARVAAMEKGPKVVVPPQELQKLRSLGYVAGP